LFRWGIKFAINHMSSPVAEFVCSIKKTVTHIGDAQAQDEFRLRCILELGH